MQFKNKLYCLTHALIFISSAAIGQISNRSEVGAGLGTFTYTGDLLRSYSILQSKVAGSVFYRTNISKVISFRTSLTGGKIGATEKPIDAFAAKRAASFNIFLLEASTAFEYHFLNWRDDVRRLRYTPYLFAGMALFGISGNQSKTAPYSNVQLCIPFGGGMKYVLNPKYYISFEIGIRKTFFDYLDNLSDGNTQFKNYQYGSFTDTDNYFFTGITLTYTFYDIPCPSNPYK